MCPTYCRSLHGLLNTWYLRTGWQIYCTTAYMASKFASSNSSLLIVLFAWVLHIYFWVELTFELYLVLKNILIHFVQGLSLRKCGIFYEIYCSTYTMQYICLGVCPLIENDRIDNRRHQVLSQLNDCLLPQNDQFLIWDNYS